MARDLRSLPSPQAPLPTRIPGEQASCLFLHRLEACAPALSKGLGEGAGIRDPGSTGFQPVGTPLKLLFKIFIIASQM
jgi:hypothetical protein